MSASAVEDLLRELAPQVLGALVRRHGQFEGCEDAVQEAILAATVQWPDEGVPDNPRGWLATVASRRLIDQMRSDHARRERESAAAAAEVVPEDVPGTDDTLRRWPARRWGLTSCRPPSPPRTPMRPRPRRPTGRRCTPFT
jgi:predicted RNA polymerase sigma factor